MTAAVVDVDFVALTLLETILTTVYIYVCVSYAVNTKVNCCIIVVILRIKVE